MNGDVAVGRTAIIVALPREAAALVRGWTQDRQHQPRGVHVWTRQDAVVVAAGMGASRAMLAVEAALATGPVRLLISAGLAGGCGPELPVGSVVEATEIVDVRTGERFQTAARSGHQAQPLVLATGGDIASVREKARLLASYHAAAVDMEAATVARLAAAHRVTFRAIKGISDDFEFELPSLGRFTTHHGHFHTRRFALHTAVRPHTWARTVRLGRHSAEALRALTEALRLTLDTSSKATPHPTA